MNDKNNEESSQEKINRILEELKAYEDKLEQILIKAIIKEEVNGDNTNNRGSS